jgi:hypothetical protein
MNEPNQPEGRVTPLLFKAGRRILAVLEKLRLLLARPSPTGCSAHGHRRAGQPGGLPQLRARSRRGDDAQPDPARAEDRARVGA